MQTEVGLKNISGYKFIQMFTLSVLRYNGNYSLELMAGVGTALAYILIIWAMGEVESTS